MKNFLYSLVLVSIIVFGTSINKNSFAKGDFSPLTSSYPYKIVEVQPSGITNDFSGGSPTFDSRKVITDLGLIVYLEDRVFAFPNPELGIGSVIRLERAPVIKLHDGKKDLELRSWTTNVSELLAEKGIELGVDDKTNFRLDSKISDGSELSIIRVAITTVVESEVINFKINKKNDPDLDYGKKRTVAGEMGEKKLTYQVRREDGEEVERILLSTEIVKEAVNQIEYTGTKVTVLSSVRGRATRTNVPNYVVSADYSRGTLIRISANGRSIMEKVTATWGTATPPAGIVLDLSANYLSSLGCSSSGCSSVLVEEIKQ